MSNYIRIVVFETKAGDRYVTSPLRLPISPARIEEKLCDVSWNVIQCIYKSAKTYLDFVKANIEAFSHVQAAYTDGTFTPPVVYRLRKNEPLPPANKYLYVRERGEVTQKSILSNIRAAMEVGVKLNAIVSSIQETLRLEEKFNLDYEFDFAHADYMLGCKIDKDALYDDSGHSLSEKKFSIEIPDRKKKLTAFTSMLVSDDSLAVLYLVLDKDTGTVICIPLREEV